MRAGISWSLRALLCSVSCLTSLSMTSSAAAQAGEAAPVRGRALGLLNAIGYGGLGFGLGLVAGYAMPSDGFGPSDEALLAIAGGTITGIVVGSIVGGQASRSIARNEPISPAKQTAVLIGVTLAGATAGALASVPLINSEGAGTPLGSDVFTFGSLTSVGAVLGLLYAVRRSGEMRARRVSVVPDIGWRGQFALNVRVRF